MKALHRPDLFSWSVFDQLRNIDLNATLWVRHEGNIAFDPVTVSDHDLQHLAQLGGLSHILLSTPTHTEAAEELSALTGATILSAPTQDTNNGSSGPAFDGLSVITLPGSTTPGEVAYLLDETTLICGELIRAPTAGSLSLLPPDRILTHSTAKTSIERLAALPHIEAVLVRNGWHIFRNGRLRLGDLAQEL